MGMMLQRHKKQPAVLPVAALPPEPEAVKAAPVEPEKVEAVAPEPEPVESFGSKKKAK